MGKIKNTAYKQKLDVKSIEMIEEKQITLFGHIKSISEGRTRRICQTKPIKA